ncbi:MAG TPA: energy transducer TonB [Pseudomonas xinjiangensis]|uniref:Protein TonB n=2 Tax=root TaxID=1 RepID=A0A7V1BR75_9GAMM|nr:energy transducer TonB [Halopseudomonas xinjiangensis]HEC48887.1 energy transducer TonB [Halopseudomonas xinjiangensis]
MRLLLSFCGAVIVALALFALMLMLVMPPAGDAPPPEELTRVNFVRSIGDTVSESRDRTPREAPERPQPPEPPPQPQVPQQPQVSANLDLNIDIPMISADVALSPAPSLEGLSASAPSVVAEAPAAPAMDSAPSISEEVTPLVDVPPNYPQRALASGIEGEVTLAFTITPDGRVEDLQVTHAEPVGVFEREARRAAARWRFAPRRENGQPVSRQATKTLYFRLEDGR